MFGSISAVHPFLSTPGILLCFLMTLAISVMTPNLKNIISGESPRFRIKVSSPGSAFTCSTRHLDTLCVCHHFKIHSIGVSWAALVNLGDKFPGKPTHSWVFLCFLSLPCPGLAARRYSRLGSPLLRVSFQYTCTLWGPSSLQQSLLPDSPILAILHFYLLLRLWKTCQNGLWFRSPTCQG